MGEKIAEETNKTTGQRVLSVDGSTIVETSAKGIGTMLGVQYQSLVTYTGKMLENGTIAGNGIGLMMGKGGEHATFTAKGVGKFDQKGGISWRGMFHIQSTHAKWSRLTSVATVFEYEVDPEGNGKGILTEVK